MWKNRSMAGVIAIIAFLATIFAIILILKSNPRTQSANYTQDNHRELSTTTGRLAWHEVFTYKATTNASYLGDGENGVFRIASGPHVRIVYKCQSADKAYPNSQVQISGEFLSVDDNSSFHEDFGVPVDEGICGPQQTAFFDNVQPGQYYLKIFTIPNGALESYTVEVDEAS